MRPILKWFVVGSWKNRWRRADDSNSWWNFMKFGLQSSRTLKEKWLQDVARLVVINILYAKLLILKSLLLVNIIGIAFCKNKLLFPNVHRAKISITLIFDLKENTLILIYLRTLHFIDQPTESFKFVLCHVSNLQLEHSVCCKILCVL